MKSVLQLAKFESAAPKNYRSWFRSDTRLSLAASSLCLQQRIGNISILLWIGATVGADVSEQQPEEKHLVQKANGERTKSEGAQTSWSANKPPQSSSSWLTTAGGGGWSGPGRSSDAPPVVSSLITRLYLSGRISPPAVLWSHSGGAGSAVADCQACEVWCLK